MRLLREHKRLCYESRWRSYFTASFPLAVAFMFLALLSVGASARVRITTRKQQYATEEQIQAKVENLGTRPVTICVEFGQWSAKEEGIESTPSPFLIEQNSDGKWQTLLVGPDVGSSRHAVEIEPGKFLEFPFRLNNPGTMRLKLLYWPGSELKVNCIDPSKRAIRVLSTAFSVR